jgi:hypothetical protein
MRLLGPIPSRPRCTMVVARDASHPRLAVATALLALVASQWAPFTLASPAAAVAAPAASSPTADIESSWGSGSAPRSAPCSDGRSPIENPRPTFTRLVAPQRAGNRDVVEARLCVGADTTSANVGLSALVVETSLDGVTFHTLYSLTEPSAATCPAPWVFDVDAGACVAPSGPGCHPVSWKPLRPYRYVRGTAVGVQFGEVCAFGPPGRPTSIEGA